MADIYRQLSLDNGLEIVVRDLTRVYFGDYHQVRLEIVCRAGSDVAGDDPQDGAVNAPLEFRRIVEKMGVPSDGTEAVKELLIQDFLNNSIAYLSADDFPAKLARSISRQPKKSIRTFVER